jgi:hypothetical protein
MPSYNASDADSSQLASESFSPAPGQSSKLPLTPESVAIQTCIVQAGWSPTMTVRVPSIGDGRDPPARPARRRAEPAAAYPAVKRLADREHGRRHPHAWDLGSARKAYPRGRGHVLAHFLHGSGPRNGRLAADPGVPAAHRPPVRRLRRHVRPLRDTREATARRGRLRLLPRFGLARAGQERRHQGTDHGVRANCV